MFGLLMSDATWLNVTNAVLGIVTLTALLAIGAAIFHDIANKARARVRDAISPGL